MANEEHIELGCCGTPIFAKLHYWECVPPIDASGPGGELASLLSLSFSLVTMVHVALQDPVYSHIVYLLHHPIACSSDLDFADGRTVPLQALCVAC
jgi:hypothetical protein